MDEKTYVTDFSMPNQAFTPSKEDLEAWNKDIDRLHFNRDLDSCMRVLACIVDEYDSKQMDRLPCQAYHLALDWLQTLKDRLEHANRDKGAIHGIKFSTVCADSDNKPVPGTERESYMIYNVENITDEEAEKLLHNMYSPNLDDRVIVIRPDQAKSLFPALCARFDKEGSEDES